MPSEPDNDSDLKRGAQILAGAARTVGVHFDNGLLAAAESRGYIAPG